jgi:hypothetical protein
VHKCHRSTSPHLAAASRDACITPGRRKAGLGRSRSALSIALMYSGMMVTSSREFFEGRLHLWDSPAKTVFEVALPLPLHSVESALEQLSWVVQRMNAGTKIDKEWRAGVLTVLRDVEKELRLRRRSMLMTKNQQPSLRNRARGSPDGG